MEDFTTRVVTLPNGKKIRAELAMNPEDVMRGMKYRESLAPDRGMLFVHGKMGSYRYWMYEVKVPLDLIWMDTNRKIVQMVHNAPPCAGPPEKCPAYGGGQQALYVLELLAGTAAKQNLHPGDVLDF